MGLRPNILWITLESTRWDHTSLSTYPRDTTPNLRRIANRTGAHSFDWCFSPGIWTRSVSGSILTGTYPSYHGAGITRQSIPDSLATVPELLGRVGYRTVAVSPNANLSAATGLDRGFDDFVWIEKSELLQNVGIRTLGKYLANLRRHGGGFTSETSKHNTGYMTADVAKRWLRRHGSDESFFMYLHFGDPHHPYHPPLPRLRREAERLSLSPREAGKLALDHHTNVSEHIASGLPYSDAEWKTLRGLYDSCIEYVDHLVGHLVDALDADEYGETIVVITADHGELFGEHGLLAHQVTVHDAVSHVPMVVDGLEIDVDDDNDLVQHVDVVHTLLDTVGAPTHQSQGVRLGSETRSEVYIQRGWDRCEKHLETYRSHDSSFDASRFLEGDLTALRTHEFKYLRGGTNSSLYRLPDEEIDVSGRFPNVATTLDERLSEWLETTGAPVDHSEKDVELSAKARRQLSDLGYFAE